MWLLLVLFIAAVAVMVVNVHTMNKPQRLPIAFDGMIQRAREYRKHCQSIGLEQQESFLGVNDHNEHLPPFGFLDFVEKRYQPDPTYLYECILPPENECGETQFTVIFMAYNPDRLVKLYNQIYKMTSDPEFQPLVKEVVVVWNGERQVEETDLGKKLVDLSKSKPVRISYPLKAGFPNDLFNRYHPRLAVTTKAIMYYDDDGPFYDFKATLGGFELWKRNSNAQIGAMARRLDPNPRQQKEKEAVLKGVDSDRVDRYFVSQCPSDEVRYNYNIFANFGANMVLPSGSFLHSQYLPCLWHPLFQELHNYVKKHPVNPDDGTVSAIVSQLSGRAPRVYSRRINQSKEEERRRLLEHDESNDQNFLLNTTVNAVDARDEYYYEGQTEGTRESLYPLRRQRRRLMDGINWDAGGNHDKKMDWGRLRSDAANSLLRYFGSVNSGSIGWCYGTKYQKDDTCSPEMARVGKLPWLNPDHTAKQTCP